MLSKVLGNYGPTKSNVGKIENLVTKVLEEVSSCKNAFIRNQWTGFLRKTVVKKMKY